MAIATKNYSEIYSRVCHFVALRKSDNAILDVQDGLICEAVYLFPNTESRGVGDVVRDLFGLKFSSSEIQDSIERSARVGRLELNGERVRCSNPESQRISANISKAQDIEKQVKLEWFDQLEEKQLIPRTDFDAAWTALQNYLSRIFRRHGVQATEFLNPGRVENGKDDTAGGILDEVLKRYLTSIPIKEARQILRSFVITRTAKRTLYLSQLVDGTFSFFALTADTQTSELLRHNLMPLKLLLDTNFIFGLLQMHVNAFVSVSNDLIQLINDNRFPFQLYYHPLTVREFNTVLEYSKQRILGKEWSQSLSRALLKAAFLSGIEYRFHELNSESKITPNEFFDRYSHVERILHSFGIRKYNDDFNHLLEDDQTLELISKYKMFLAPKEKAHNTLLHDVVLWRTLQTIRKKSAEPFGAGAMFLSCDYSFFNFDRKVLRQVGQVGTVVLPNVFLQLLRPFVARTNDFDSKFIETFALPEFRTIHGADNRALSRIAQTLTLYSDIDENLALKLLTDEALISQVRNLKEDDPSIQPLIEQAIVSENQMLRNDLQAAAESLSNREVAFEQMTSQIQELKLNASAQQIGKRAVVMAAKSASVAANAERQRADLTAAALEQEKNARIQAEEQARELEQQLLQTRRSRMRVVSGIKLTIRLLLYSVPALFLSVAVHRGVLKAPAYPRTFIAALSLGGAFIACLDLALRAHNRRRGLLLAAWLVFAVIALAAFGFDFQAATWMLVAIGILGVVAQIIDR
jgi:hypothetical protein